LIPIDIFDESFVWYWWHTNQSLSFFACGAVCWLYSGAFHYNSTSLVCVLWAIIVSDLPLLLLLCPSILWLFPGCLCSIPYPPHLVHNRSNVILTSYSIRHRCFLLDIYVSCVWYSSIGCVFLYTGQGKFHASTTDTLDYVVSQANLTSENLRNVSDYLNAAKKVDVQSSILPQDVLSSIDNIQGKINSSATTLSVKTMENQDKIQNVLDIM